jgi:hypothetical protein
MRVNATFLEQKALQYRRDAAHLRVPRDRRRIEELAETYEWRLALLRRERPASPDDPASRTGSIQ